MPKEARVPLCFGRFPTSPYPFTAEIDKIKKKKMLMKLAKSVYSTKVMKEVKCSICMEPPHNGVILHCSNVEKGCRPYMCNTSYSHSKCLSRFLKSPGSTSCPLCGGKVDNEWIVIARIRCFNNYIPRSCSVETCEFTGNYRELENHASLEHPSVRPSEVDPICEQKLMLTRLVRLERARKSEDGDLIALGSDFERVVAVNEGHHHPSNERTC